MGSMWSCGTRIDCWSASSYFCRGDDQAILSADGQVVLQLLRMQHCDIQLGIHGRHITRCDQTICQFNGCSGRSDCAPAQIDQRAVILWL